MAITRKKFGRIIPGYQPEKVELRGYDSYTVTLGDKLRGERATLGKTLDDIQKETRLRIEFLLGIENADITAFPAPSFIAGYVRSYASHLNLDPDECFNQFCKESGFIGLQSEIDGKKRNKVIKPTKLLDEPILNPQIQKKKINNGILNNFSFSGLFSLTALLVLILGLGYGGVTVLNEVQKVNLSPINQPPSVQSISSTSIDENSFFDDVESNNTNIASNSDLEKFYRPTELVLPLMTPRDGPISAIDPAISGVYVEDKNSVISKSNQEDIIQVKKNPQVIEEDLPSVYVVAQKPAWVRIYEPNGNILFENILDTGQRYEVPQSAQTAMLRAGNSGSVYLMIDNNFYGPLGTATGVAKKVNLRAETILENYTLVENNLTLPLEPPINTKIVVQSIE
ncbi:MAG: helix-turn-helix domain-containing protein [Rhodobacteraceae bacterium]|nr:MAG: helix-turn-helix domain-containing protein [Paracoccaceae bacterium]